MSETSIPGSIFAPATSAPPPHVADKPYVAPTVTVPTPSYIAAKEATVDPAVGPTGKARLRAWEDANLGKRVVRTHLGHIEKGYGSPFKALSPEKLAEYDSLEKLVAAEQAVDDANEKLSAAKVALTTAKQGVIDAKKATDKAVADAAKADADAAAAAKEDAATAAGAVNPAGHPPGWYDAPVASSGNL
jgi:hypothetical protein